MILESTGSGLRNIRICLLRVRDPLTRVVGFQKYARMAHYPIGYPFHI